MTDTDHLKAYISRVNMFTSFARLGGKVFDIENLTDTDCKDLIKNVECELSPENLTCDGEIRGEALRIKADRLRAVRRALLQMS